MSSDKAATPVAAQDSAQKNSPIAGPLDEEATVQMDQEKQTCYWNGQSFEQGSKVDADGSCYECSFGTWIPLP